MQQILIVNGVPSEMSQYAGNELVRSVIISLFSWARSRDDDEVEGGRRNGFWGDTYEDSALAETGSRLWLLSREKLTAETLQKCKDYAEQALAWLVKESVADKVEVEVERNGLDRVDLLVCISRDAENIRLQFADVWKGLKNGI